MEPRRYRDLAVSNRWGVQTPYVLFSRHRHLEGMPIPIKTRSNEMLLPTQIQRSLFHMTLITDEEAMSTPVPYDYHLHTKQWNITVPKETLQDFLSHGEKEIYDKVMEAE